MEAGHEKLGEGTGGFFSALMTSGSFTMMQAGSFEELEDFGESYGATASSTRTGKCVCIRLRCKGLKTIDACTNADKERRTCKGAHDPSKDPNCVPTDTFAQMKQESEAQKTNGKPQCEMEQNEEDQLGETTGALQFGGAPVGACFRKQVLGDTDANGKGKYTMTTMAASGGFE